MAFLFVSTRREHAFSHISLLASLILDAELLPIPYRDYFLNQQGNRMKFIVPIILFLLVGSSVHAQRPSLSSIKSWGYQLQDISAAEVASNPSFQLVVMDYSSDGTEDTKFTVDEIRDIRESGKTVIAYFSIGEAEDYRFYWKPEWNATPPAWLGPENAEWPGNYKVRFWDTDWQNIVFGYLDKVIAQGFEGIYLDIIDGFSYWMYDNPEQPMADTLMVDFVRSIRGYADTHAPAAFYILPQNPDDILHSDNITAAMRNSFFSTIDAVGVEDVFFPGDQDENNPFAPNTDRIAHLQEFRNAGRPVFSIEYLTQQKKKNQYLTAAQNAGFIPYTCTRELNALCNGISTSAERTPPLYPAGVELRISPQPLSAEGVLHLSCGTRTTLSISLFDAAGRFMRSLYAGELLQGEHLIPFEGASLSSGTYLLSAKTGEGVFTTPLRVVR